MTDVEVEDLSVCGLCAAMVDYEDREPTGYCWPCEVEVYKSESEQLTLRVAELTEALRQTLLMCRCCGTGKYETNCTRCGDSSDDHECNDETRDCSRLVCVAARAALAKGGAA